jgi:intracellular multiplication protein IcmB
MSTLLDPVLDSIDALLSWMGSAIGQTNENYCELETADDSHVLVAKDGSLLSIIRLFGATQLVGPEEFQRIHAGLSRSFSATLNRLGYAIQVYFSHDRSTIKSEIEQIFAPAQQTAERLKLDLKDLFEERVQHLSKYCASEECFIVLWTRPTGLSKNQLDTSRKNSLEAFKKAKLPPFTVKEAQNIYAAVTELRESHDSFVRATLNDMRDISLHAKLLNVHDALYEVRKSVDPAATSPDWKPVLPGDKIPMRETQGPKGRDISEVMWPPLHRQLIPRDGEVVNLRTARIGDRLYSSLFIDLFPQDVQSFYELFKRLNASQVPWRISFLIEGGGIQSLGFKQTLASVLSFASTQNKLISGAADLLRYMNDNTDDAVVKLRVSAATWANLGDEKILRTRSAEVMKALQGWGLCEVSEISGDAYAGALSSALAITTSSVATPSIAPVSQVVYMLPFERPASPWATGATLFRSPDGKPWPYQPGSSQQTTWIDLIFARPGSGKSVLSNSINLALCLQGGIQRLPRISIIDIGPSSSGLISLLQEALPKDKQHLVAYHRLRMTPDYAINPFDTQLGSRKPTPQERSFLVNFVTLLATPVGDTKAYDGIPDMIGMLVDELYKTLADGNNPHRYTRDIEHKVDALLPTLGGLKLDAHTTWWEITDALFAGGHIHEAMLAQRYAVPLLPDTVAICRNPAIEDLYGKIVVPTGEPILSAFTRMISSAVREYPTLSRVTAFDLGEARVVSLDLDEVAKTGGESADRQTAVMYMLARYVLGRQFYLTEDNLEDMFPKYQEYHRTRILEIREDPKRLVLDEFHRTSKAKAVRDQVIVDMREGRKWKVQVALLSQSLEDFEAVMVEFATSIFIMDAGPKQAVDKSVKTFGLSETAQLALTNRVHGPRPEGATFLAQFATKFGMNTQLCTSTLGPIELWAFNTTAEDSRIRNALYKRIGAAETRKLLATLYPAGSAANVVEHRLSQRKDTKGQFSEEEASSVINELIEEIMTAYNASGPGRG